MVNKMVVTALSALLVASMLGLDATPADAKNWRKSQKREQKREFKHWLRSQNHDWRRWMHQQKYEWWKWVREQKHLFRQGDWDPNVDFTFPGDGSDDTNSGGDSDTGNTGGEPPVVVEEPKPRFEMLEEYSNAAVRDNETGLIWQRTPRTSTLVWEAARYTCSATQVGGRMGWRMPSSAELMTLLDTKNEDANGLRLPADHLFTNVQGSTFYWTATENRPPRTGFHVVHFKDSPYIGWRVPGTTSPQFHLWCVRGTLQGRVAAQ